MAGQLRPLRSKVVYLRSARSARQSLARYIPASYPPSALTPQSITVAPFSSLMTSVFRSSLQSSISSMTYDPISLTLIKVSPLLALG